MSDSISNLTTESINPATAAIDQMSTIEMVRLFNREDQQVARSVEEVLPQIAQAVDAIAERMRQGGRLVYCGAGTSGRLGVLDASECPPTFNTPPTQVVGIIAGGESALRKSVEAAEDSPEMGLGDMKKISLNHLDSLVGISASGRTPYVLGALEYAKQVGAMRISLACNRPSLIGEYAEIRIDLQTGPEVISGSTRLKAGTAQKLVLNNISTGVMVRLGKTFGNLMIDVQPTNYKLRERRRRIMQLACGLDAEQAEMVLEQCDGEVKTAIVVILGNCTPSEARSRLAKANNVVREAIKES